MTHDLREQEIFGRPVLWGMNFNHAGLGRLLGIPRRQALSTYGQIAAVLGPAKSCPRGWKRAEPQSLRARRSVHRVVGSTAR